MIRMCMANLSETRSMLDLVTTFRSNLNPCSLDMCCRVCTQQSHVHEALQWYRVPSILYKIQYYFGLNKMHQKWHCVKCSVCVKGLTKSQPTCNFKVTDRVAEGLDVFGIKLIFFYYKCTLKVIFTQNQKMITYEVCRL